MQGTLSKGAVVVGTWPSDPLKAGARLRKIRRARALLWASILLLIAPFVAIPLWANLGVLTPLFALALFALLSLPWMFHRLRRLTCPRCEESFVGAGRRSGGWLGNPVPSRCSHCDLSITADSHYSWPSHDDGAV